MVIFALKLVSFDQEMVICVFLNSYFWIEKTIFDGHFDLKSLFLGKMTIFGSKILNFDQLEYEPKWSLFLVRMNPPRSQ